jgi:hypothetical protein
MLQCSDPTNIFRDRPQEFVSIFAGMMRSFRFTAIVFLFCLVVCACKSHKPYNPFLHQKVKPGEQQRRDDAKVIKKGNRAYKKKEEASRKHLFGRKHAPKK